MKERLTTIFNVLMQIEVKGNNVVMLADCLRELQAIINEPVNEERETPNASN